MPGLPELEIPAWSGCLGLEPTPEMFTAHLVAVFREARRTLRDDGVAFLNLGDSYTTTPGNGRGGESVDGGIPHRSGTDKARCGLKPKDLVMIPARVALALQADTWWVRSDIVWAKGLSFCPTYAGSCMPESVTSRPTKAHEYIFLLSKSATYYYDHVAVREPSTGQTGQAANFARDSKDADVPGQARRQHRTEREPTADNGTRNLRSVWAVNPGNFAQAHFATFPPELVEPMIKAGTSEAGCCPSCGAPWERVTEKESRVPWEERKAKGATSGSLERGYNENHGEGTDHTLGCTVTTTGWRPTCTCDAGDPVPCVVLDPFSGAGTTLLVADRLGRDCIGIELNPEYVAMAQDRVYDDAPLFADVAVEAMT